MFTFFSPLKNSFGILWKHPRMIVFFGAFFFFGSTVAIGFREVPKETPLKVLETETSPCTWRWNRMQDEISDQPGHFVVARSDLCGKEARAWSRQLVLASEENSAKKVLSSDGALDSEIASLTAGYPIERMAVSIARYDRPVAALLIGIAKKESNWGKRVPRSDDGADCFNYWGFKGAGSRGIAMGHGCFGSPEEAVEKVGDRIAELVDLRSTSDPKNFTIWKCGSSCRTHSPESVQKWVSDVDQYYRLLASR